MSQSQSKDREFRRIIDEMVKKELARREKAAKAKAAKAKAAVRTQAEPAGESEGGGTRAVLSQVRFQSFTLVETSNIGGKRVRHVAQSLEFKGDGVAPSGLDSIAVTQFRDSPGTKAQKDGVLRFKNGEIDAPPPTTNTTT